MKSRILPITVLLVAAGLTAQESRGGGGTYQPLSGIQRQTGGAADGLLTSSFHVSELLDWIGNSKQSSINSFRADTSVGGTLGYALRTAGTDLRFRYNGGALFYDTPVYSRRLPGVPLTRNTSFHQLDLDDSIQFKRFVITGGDVFHYSPSQYSLGGGIPGVGGIGSQIGGLGFGNPGILPGLGLLNQGTTIFSNAAFAQVDYQLSRRSTITSSAAYGISRLPDFKVFDSNQLTFQEGFDYKVTARTSVAFAVDHSHSKYLHAPLTTDVTFGSVSVSHIFTRAFNVKASFGPQVTDTSGLKTRHSFSGHANAAYIRGRNNFNATYSRRTSTGGLAQFGTDIDQFGAGWNRDMSRRWKLNAQTSFVHGTTIRNHGTINNQQIGIQADRQFLQNVSGYVSYTYRHQSNSSNTAAPVLFTGNANTVGFGLTYTPHALRLKR